MPRPVYRLASDTTRRRFASSRWFLARRPSSATHSMSIRASAGRSAAVWASFSSANRPASIRLASSTSCSALSRDLADLLQVVLDRVGGRTGRRDLRGGQVVVVVAVDEGLVFGLLGRRAACSPAAAAGPAATGAAASAARGRPRPGRRVGGGPRLPRSMSSAPSWSTSHCRPRARRPGQLPGPRRRDPRCPPPPGPLPPAPPSSRSVIPGRCHCPLGSSARPAPPPARAARRSPVPVTACAPPARSPRRPADHPVRAPGTLRREARPTAHASTYQGTDSTRVLDRSLPPLALLAGLPPRRGALSACHRGHPFLRWERQRPAQAANDYVNVDRADDTDNLSCARRRATD